MTPGATSSSPAPTRARCASAFVALTASNPTSDVFLAKLDTERLKYEHNTYIVGAAVEIPRRSHHLAAGAAPGDCPPSRFSRRSTPIRTSSTRCLVDLREAPVRHPARPTARFRWPLSANPPATGGTVLSCVGRSTWPEADDPRAAAPTDNEKRARLHLAGTPVNLKPRVTGFPFHFQGLSFTEVDGAAVDGTTLQFTAPDRGWTGLQFLHSGTATPDPTRHASLFEVVRTERFDDPRYLVAGTAVVGETLRRNDHHDPEGLQGTPNELSFDHGAGEDRAHDRATRAGPIIPVNVDRQGTADDLVVIWYRLSPDTGTAWPEDPVRYTVIWPVDATRIIIASGRGFTLTAATATAARVYNQPDPRLPGCNPNEEHAFKDGDRIYALRDDLNAIVGASEPFVLLKYRDRGPASGRCSRFSRRRGLGWARPSSATRSPANCWI